MNPFDQPLSVFSIGHSNHALPDFLDLLKLQRVEVLVDVRSQPYSKYTGQFNGAELKKAVIEAGLKYLFMGKELGGRPQGDEFYDPTGRVIYAKVARSPLFLAGLDRLQAGLTRYRVALMCAEEDPTGCHRRLLVGRVLTERGVLLDHIRGDGSVQSETALAQELAGLGQQLSLFGDGDEEYTQWKSLRSVSPKKVPPSSSAS